MTNYELRISNLRKKKFFLQPRQKLDALLVANLTNIGYLTGFWGSFGRLLITRKNTILISDSRYSERAKNLLKNRRDKAMPCLYQEIDQEKDFWQKLAKKYRIHHLGYEASHVSVEQLAKLKKVFRTVETRHALSLHKTVHVVEQLRQQKSEEEIQLIQKAAKIADTSLEKTLSYLKIGITEKKLAWIFEKIAREELSADSLSFPTIVAFGKNSATPHHETGDAKLTKNSPILFDCGVKYKRYCSDMTRSFFFGKQTEKWLKTFQLVKKAQEEGMKLIRPGKKCSSPDLKAREVFGKDAKYFGHSFGHGVGIEVHESPSLSSKSFDKFQENMVVTAEPGLYFPGEFGIRIEDLMVVKKTGNVVLSRFPYEMSV
ncbi:aminopeptidase P family protein [Candidatus Peregrinibacteria bacterium]|nr:aminopeptidase P family protein [Candidatus Peregrinibacteria bacterium]